MEFKAQIKAQNKAQNPAQCDQHPTDWLIKEVCKWINETDNNDHVREAMESSGGWEVWLQLELLFALRPGVVRGFHGKLEREKTNIWEQSPKARIDFWFTWHEQHDPNDEKLQHWGLELKCRTKAEEHNEFNKRVYLDITKCTQKPEAARTALYVIAISHDPDDINGFNQANANNTYYTEVPRQHQKTIYVIWRKEIH